MFQCYSLRSSHPRLLPQSPKVCSVHPIYMFDLGLSFSFSSPVATAEFSIFAGILSAALSQHYLLGFEIAFRIWINWKRSVFIPLPKKGRAKECSNYCTTELISHASKVVLKILQARLQQYLNRKLTDVQAGFRKGRGTRNQIANICWIIKKARQFQKNICICFIDYAKAFVWTTANSGKFYKRWEYQTTWPVSWEICMQVRKHS